MATNDTVLRMLADLDLKVNATQVQKDWKKTQDQIYKSFSEMIGEAVSLGFKHTNLSDMAKRLTKIQDDINESRQRALKLEHQIQEKLARKESAENEKRILAEEKLKLKHLEARSKQEFKAGERLIARRKKAYEEAERLASRTMGEKAEEFGDSLSKGFDDLKSFNIGNIFKGIGARTEAKGAQMMMKSEQGGAMAGMMSQIGGFLAKLGPALVAIGGIAAGLAAIVKIILDADSKAKELNRALLDGGVAATDLADGFNDVTEKVDLLRRSFTEALGFNRKWGITAKDSLEVLKSYDEAGVPVRNLVGNIEDAEAATQRLQGATEGALAYSKLLGISNTEAAAHMAGYMEELGLTLQGVEERFSEITAAAKESGFATKRFFNMVLQATTGMSMYNVRLDEAAGLLIHLGKILGQKMGGDFLQQLTKGFKDEGTLDRVRKTMTTGVEKSLNILRKDSVNATQEFLDKLRGASEDTKAAFQKAFEETGLKGDLGKLNPEQLAQQFSKLSTAQQGKLLVRAEAMKAKGPEAEGMVRMLSDVMHKSMAFRGGLGGAQAARQRAGAGAALLLQMNELAGVIGKRVDQLEDTDIVNRAAWEQITGKAGEEFDKLFEVSRRFAQEQALAAEYQERIRKGDQQAQEEFNTRFAKEFGIVLDKSGQRFKAQVDKAGEVDLEKSLSQSTRIGVGNTLEDLVLSSGKNLKQEAAVPEDIALARSVADNTTELTKILEQGVEYFLEKIYYSVEWIASWLGHPKLNPEQKKLIADARKDALQRSEGFRKRARKYGEDAALTKKELAMGDLPPEKMAEVRDKLATQQQGQQQASALSAVYATAAEGVQKLIGQSPENQQASLANVKTSNDLLSAILQSSNTQQELADRLGVSGKMAGAAGDAKARFQEQVSARSFGQWLSDFMWGSTDGPLAFGGTIKERQELPGQDADAAAQRASTAVLESKLGVPLSQLGGMTPADKRFDLQLSKKELKAEEKIVGDQTTKLVNSDKEIAQQDRERKIVQALTGPGGLTGDLAQKMAQRIVAKQPLGDLEAKFLEKVAKPGGKEGEKISRQDLILQATGEAAHDFLLQVGEGGRLKFAQRIDTADQVTAVAAKPGGPVARARGGSSVIHNHFYNDGQGIFASMKRWQQANGV